MSGAKTSLRSVFMSPAAKHWYMRSTVAIAPVAGGDSSIVATSTPFSPLLAQLLNESYTDVVDVQDQQTGPHHPLGTIAGTESGAVCAGAGAPAVMPRSDQTFTFSWRPRTSSSAT